MFRTLLYNAEAPRRLRVAAVAMQCDREPTANRAKIVQTVEATLQAHPEVELIVLGEMILGWYNPGEMPAYHRQIAEPIPGETTRTLGDLAMAHGIYLSFGLGEIDGEALYNTQVLLNPAGELQALHRKWHLKPGERAANYCPGTAPVTLTEIKGIKTGIVICSDAAHPLTMRALIRSRLELILLSLADDRDEGHFAAYFNARMYDAWIVTANRYGNEEGWYWNGHVVISDPLGSLRATAQDRAGALVHELGFDADRSWLKKVTRNLVVKAALPAHLLRHWRKMREYL